MSDIITKIQNKIKYQEKIHDSIQEIDDILANNIHLLEENEIVELRNEKNNLEKRLIKSNLSLDEKFNNFFYTSKDIEDAPETQWLIPEVIPSSTIGVFYGAPGSGKSSILIDYCYQILRNFENTYIIYIDADQGISKIKESHINELISTYGLRFKYGGKSKDDISATAQNLLKEVVQTQLNFRERKYIIIEDSLTLITPKRNGFIDVQKLYKFERQIRDLNGTVIIIHHLNKDGMFADSQQIENYADYTFFAQRNAFNSFNLFHPKKASRYDIKEKAYKVENRKIVEEIDFQMANISNSEATFVNLVYDLLHDSEMNQSEIMKYLKQISFFTKFTVGEKKVISWLEKWSKNGKWSCEQRVNEKNAKFYYVQTAKLAELPNSDKERA
jgi:archaellum biogenesis ATPase FlaH